MFGAGSFHRPELSIDLPTIAVIITRCPVVVIGQQFPHFQSMGQRFLIKVALQGGYLPSTITVHIWATIPIISHHMSAVARPHHVMSAASTHG